MAQVTFIEQDGSRHVVDVEPGDTVMAGATSNLVPGIVAECGGARACATCHVYVADDWCERVGPPSEEEADMLDFAEDVRPGSRLSCQILMTDALDGLVVHVPASQY